MKLVLLACVALCATAVGAQTPDALQAAQERLSAERARLQAERVQVEQAHEARLRECWQRFAVNTCLRDVRRSRYAALDPIRAQELALNAEERALLAQQRDERLHEKADKAAVQERRP